MRSIKRLVAIALMSVFALSVAGCNMIEKTPEAIAKTTVAKVGNKKITRAELDAYPYVASAIEQYKQQYGENYDQSEEIKENLKQVKLQTINEMTVIEALIQEADKLKVTPSEEELNKEINKNIEDIKTAQGIKDDAAFKEFLQSQGLTEESFKKILRQNAIIQALQNELTKSATVEDKEIQEYYNKFKDKYPKDTNNPTKLTLSHILVSDESLAKSIKDQLDKGADFAELAKKYSTDGTKDSGGSLGEVPTINHNYDQDFMDAAMQLKEGEVSAPVKTQFGYHLIKVNKRVDAPLKTFGEAKEDIKTELLNKKKDSIWNQKLKEIKENANIKIYEDNLV